METLMTVTDYAREKMLEGNWSKVVANCRIGVQPIKISKKRVKFKFGIIDRDTNKWIVVWAIVDLTELSTVSIKGDGLSLDMAKLVTLK